MAPVRQEGVPVEVEILHGTPFLEIIREVLRNGHDLVVKTASEKGITRLFGTTAMHLLRKCPCPVWLVKTTKHQSCPRVFAAVDPAPEEPEREAINRKILELSASLADHQNGELHVIHAWSAYGESHMRLHVPEEEIREYVEEARKLAASRVTDLLADVRLKLPDDRVHLEKGAAGFAVPNSIERNRADLLVMGTLARTGVAGLFIGNSAEQIVSRIGCSVMAVKPDGFVSPVTL